MQRLITTISLCVAAAVPGAAQTKEVLPAKPEAPLLSPAEWSRLRALTTSLRTPEGCRSIFRAQPRLSSNYTSEDFFLGKMAKWQGRIHSIEEKQEQAKDLSVEVFHREDGTEVYYLTFHHREPVNSITILKSIWQEDSLLAVDLMKGFTKVPFSAADPQPYRYRYYPASPPKNTGSQGNNPYAITTGSAH